MRINAENYYSPEANKMFWSYSQFKAFDNCEACGLAQSLGLYEREETDALLIGSYVDAHFSGEEDAFIAGHADKMFTRNGELYAKFAHATRMIQRVESEPVMMDYLEGEKQVIMSAELFDVQWKIKMDIYNSIGPNKRIVDFKTVKDFEPVYRDGFGKVHFIEAWGYDIQGAIYQKIEQLVTGRSEPLPYFIAAVTKEKVPDIDIWQLPQHVLDTALKVVESKIDRFDLVKNGDIEPRRCGKCDYCKITKRLKEPTIYEIKEA